MSFFICSNCQKKVPLVSYGTKNRNHCPFCLFSLHVDSQKGDRDSPCKGIMIPIGRFYKEDGEEMLVHTCQKCGFVRWNRVAGDDSYEDIEKLPKILDPR